MSINDYSDKTDRLHPPLKIHSVFVANFQVMCIDRIITVLPNH